MHKQREMAIETADVIRQSASAAPEIGILTGTGLGETLSSLAVAAQFDYGDLPHFPVSTVQSHPGKLLLGTLAGKQVAAMQGRFHLYEGYSPKAVSFPIRVMQELGVKTLIVTNAAGGLNLSFAAGGIMLISDHINLTGENPLAGDNADGWGVRFPDMVETYDKGLAETTRSAAALLGISLFEGVYAGLSGPSLETPAEMRYLSRIGADAVGFSTITEVIAAKHAGVRVLGLSMITNINDPDHPVPATLEGVIEVAEKAAPQLSTLIQAVVGEIDA